MKYYNISTGERIYNWANDMDGMNARTLEVIDSVLTATNEINNYWREDYSYIEANKKEVIFSSGIHYKYNKVKEIFNTLEYNNKVDEFRQLYSTNEQAQVVAVYYYLQTYGISKDLKEAVCLYKKLVELEMYKLVARDIRKKAIMEHYSQIYGKLMYISAIRLKNGIYKSSIGNYVDIECILGKSGEYLRIGRDDAIDYVLSYEDFENKLNSIKSELEFHIEKNKPIEYFR